MYVYYYPLDNFTLKRSYDGRCRKYPVRKCCDLRLEPRDEGGPGGNLDPSVVKAAIGIDAFLTGVV